jgi:hypothetical protein
MTTIVIQLPDDQAARLTALAQRLNTSVEDLAAAKLRDLADAPDEEFQRLMHRVLQKNAQLYRRLA